MKKQKRRGNPVLLVIILLLVLVFLYSGLRFLESTVFYKDQPQEQPTQSRTIIRDGVEYFPRQDMTVLMLAGIDEEGPVEDSHSYNNSGEADMVSLLILDHQNETINLLSLNRDTMMDIQVLGLGGRPAGTIYGQLALAHTYGSGLEDSCVNLRQTVSDFLYGVQIDHYVVMNMDAIGILNDAVGGVTVDIQDDFSQISDPLPSGTVTLRGKQAVTFVRTRQGVGDQLNLTRMERQRQYMEGFMDALGESLEASPDTVLTAYQESSPYLVTDCSVTVVNALVERCGDYRLDRVISLPGENVAGEEFMEYYADEEALDELILQLLYAPKT